MSLEKVSYQKLEEETGKVDSKIGDLSSLSTTNKTSLVDAVNETFQDVSNGKSLVASAITDKGIQTASDATFQTMATNISNIQTGITPTGTINITTNGTHDVTNYASANVSVSGGASPTLITKNITANGTYNASTDSADGYSSVTVSVQPTNYRGGTFTISSSDAPNTANKYKATTLDADVLLHKDDDNFFVAIFPQFAVTNLAKSLAGIIGNRPFTYESEYRYGIVIYQTATSYKVGTQLRAVPVKTDPDAQAIGSFWVQTGNDAGLWLRGTSTYKWAAGTYMYVCGW